MLTELEVTRHAASPEVFGEEVVLDEIVPRIATAIVDGKVVAIRIADQPPYGIMMRVDDRRLVERVWVAKGRIDLAGRPDLTKKPVTALHESHRKAHIDWTKLAEFGFDEALVDDLLRCGVHTVLPVRKTMPEHLVTQAPHGCTISVMQFSQIHFARIVDMVAEVDPDAKVGGTSLNFSGKDAYTDTQQVIRDMFKHPYVDMFCLSKVNTGCGQEGLFHAMISLVRGGVVIDREGIGLTRTRQKLNERGIRIITK